MVVLVALRTQANLAVHLDHVFAAQRMSHLLVVDDHLHQTGVVTQIDECHAAMITAAVHPTGKRDVLADQTFGHVGGVMCTISRLLAHASSILHCIVLG